MPANARSSRPKKPTLKSRLPSLVEAALHEARAHGSYPPTVRQLYDRIVATTSVDVYQASPDELPAIDIHSL